MLNIDLVKLLMFLFSICRFVPVYHNKIMKYLCKYFIKYDYLVLLFIGVNPIILSIQFCAKFVHAWGTWQFSKYWPSCIKEVPNTISNKLQFSRWKSVSWINYVQLCGLVFIYTAVLTWLWQYTLFLFLLWFHISRGRNPLKRTDWNCVSQFTAINVGIPCWDPFSEDYSCFGLYWNVFE